MRERIVGAAQGLSLRRTGESAAAVVFVFDDIIHHAQFDDGVAVCTHTRIHEQVVYVFQTAAYIVEAVFTFTILIIPSCNSNCTEFSRKEVSCVFKRKTYFSQPAGTAAFGTVKYQCIQVFTAQGRYLLLTNHPANGIDDITFTTTIWPDNPRYAFIKIENRFVGEALEPLYL